MGAAIAGGVYSDGRQACVCAQLSAKRNKNTQTHNA